MTAPTEGVDAARGPLRGHASPSRRNVLVVVTRVAINHGNMRPTPEWLEDRMLVTAQVTAPPIRLALERGVDLVWVWRVNDELRFQAHDWAREMGLHGHVTTVPYGEVTIPGLPRRVIAIRIDSDDALHPDTYERYAEEDWAYKRLWDINSGYQLKLPEGKVNVHDRGPKRRSAFFAIGLTRHDGIDVRNYHSAPVPREPAERLLDSRPGSRIQTIHRYGGGNISNAWRRSNPALSPAEAERVLEGFGIRLS